VGAASCGGQQCILLSSYKPVVAFIFARDAIFLATNGIIHHFNFDARILPTNFFAESR
jgi:hypothetical protein